MSVIYINSFSFYDTDAQVYISAVEAADGQGLEDGVKDAINLFVLGCKSDGIWSAIKASCILAGARTLTGALVPLVGTAPTNVGPFVSGDYNRETGLVGDGSTKYLNSNRNNNADPQNNNHNAVFPTTAGTAVMLATVDQVSTGHNFIGLNGVRCRHQSDGALGTTANTLKGVSRGNSANYVGRSGNANTTISISSETPLNSNLTLFGTPNTGGSPSYGTHRLSFYSIGESLDLALLDARVTTLINAFAAAIP
jgi:hypothetical protein